MKTHRNLKVRLHSDLIEAGCDEAGRGCLAGPVFAAAVVLPPDFKNDQLTDSKKMTEKQRYELRTLIEEQALDFGVGVCTPEEIDEINILWASVKAMHKALNKLSPVPQHILVDGNRFLPFNEIPHTCVVGGDGKFLSIAAASVLAKTYRDDYMKRIHHEFPAYDWENNKGYPTKRHRKAIRLYGISHHHRKSFNLSDSQLDINF